MFIFGGGAVSQTVAKYQAGSLALVAQSLNYGGSIQAITADNEFVYAGGTAVTTVKKYQISDMAIIAQTPPYGGNIWGIAVDDAHVYVVGGINPTIKRYLKTDLSFIDESPNYGGTIVCIVMDDTHIYIGGSTTQRVRKYLKADLSFLTESPVYGSIWDLAEDDDYIYCVGFAQRVYKYLKTDLSTVTWSPSYGGGIYAIVADDTHVYVAGATTRTVRKYLKTDLSYIAQSANYGGDIWDLTQDEAYVYAAGTVTNRIRKYRKSDMALITESPDYGGQFYALVMAPWTVPTGTTDPATAVAANSATLNGTLEDDGGLVCDCGFQWGETMAYGNTTPTESKTTGQTFAQAIAGLDPNKTYHFRAIATNATGTSYGADRTFVTSTALPTVTTDPITGASTLNGTLDDDGGISCDCGFEWGPTVAYGNITSTQSRTTGQTFSQILGGLASGTTYHYRAFATNGAGTSNGADRTFATPAGLPTATTNPATGIGMLLAVLNGTLTDDGGEICECGFEWGADITYGLTTPTESKLTGETFSQTVRGLFPGTEYHFRAFAINSHGAAYGDDESFYSKPSVSRAYALAREEL